VPLLGHHNSSRRDVENFYSFWYDFDSWREYSYLDEEDKERGQDREERRWIDKENKAARQKRKKEEMARIRTLVDNAYNCDPRIPRFKEEEKQKKLAQKKAKEDERRAKMEEEARLMRIEEEKALHKKQAEEEACKAKREQERKEKDALKKQKKKVRKSLEELFENFDSISNINERVQYLEQFDKMCQLFSLVELNELKKSVEASGSMHEKRIIFVENVEKINSMNNGTGHHGSNGNLSQSSISLKVRTDETTNGNPKTWSFEDCQLLIKAVNLFPAGTKDRWEVVTKYLEQHSASKTKRKARDVLAKAKELQKLGMFCELNIISVSLNFDIPI